MKLIRNHVGSKPKPNLNGSETFFITRRCRAVAGGGGGGLGVFIELPGLRFYFRSPGETGLVGWGADVNRRGHDSPSRGGGVLFHEKRVGAENRQKLLAVSTVAMLHMSLKNSFSI
ncbi:unnamed protein product, partial [Iphiclides podalirius]